MKRGTTTWGTPAPAKPSSHTLVITPERMRQLLSLCHPDRHNGSAMSTEVFQWLQENKRKVVDSKI
jgi:hypothetical protein